MFLQRADRWFPSNWSVLWVSRATEGVPGWLGSIHLADFRIAGFLGNLLPLQPKSPWSPPKGFGRRLVLSTKPLDCVRRSFQLYLALVSWLSPSGALLVDRLDPRKTSSLKGLQQAFLKGGKTRIGAPKKTIRVPRSRSQDGNRRQARKLLLLAKIDKLRKIGPRPKRVPKFRAQQVSVSITITRLRFGKRLLPKVNPG